jgi:beta-glucosidase
MTELRDSWRVLSGQDMWSLPAAPELGLPSLVMSDGPIGVRGTGWAETSVALPSPTALAATWDPALARRAGELLGQEARRKGVHVLLAPTINLHRSPRGGRHFECYSEDPWLTGVIAAGFIKGVQSQGVAATAKHFVANDSETQRMTADVQVSERALRELYLLPFEMAVRAGVWAVMAAYNSVNGTTMTEHDRLLNGVLKGEWGFDGIVVSDWLAARSTVQTALGGLDVVMPAMNSPWADQLGDAELPAGVLEEKIGRVQLLASRVTGLTSSSIDGPALAREIAARSFVLARNDGTLPLTGNESIALIGIAASEGRAMGGGSAEVVPEHVISPLDGLRAVLGPNRVSYSMGTDPRATLPKAAGPQWTELTVRCFDESGEAVYTQALEQAAVRWIGQLPAPGIVSVEIAGRLSPAQGTHTFSVRGVGEFRLTADELSEPGEGLLYQGTIWPDLSDPIGFLIPPEERLEAEFTGPVTLRLRHEVLQGLPLPAISFHLGHLDPRPADEELFRRAEEAAAAADVAVVVVGTTEDVESEGLDRGTLALPGRQDELVARVLAANPRTIVVVNAGAPVLMPWAGDVPAVLLTWFPGQEGGAALADVLLGRAEPTGRLPTTWPRFDEDVPVNVVQPLDGLLGYPEELFIGYKAWDQLTVDPLYPFGHGLGYTEWEYETMVAGPEKVTVTVRNAGPREGREVIQIYAEAREPRSGRPRRWLAGFASCAAAPGEVTEVEVVLGYRAFQCWDDGWQTLPGEYVLHAGRSIGDLRIRAVVHVT